MMLCPFSCSFWTVTHYISVISVLFEYNFNRIVSNRWHSRDDILYQMHTVTSRIFFSSVQKSTKASRDSSTLRHRERRKPKTHITININPNLSSAIWRMAEPPTELKAAFLTKRLIWFYGLIMSRIAGQIYGMATALR